MLVVTVHKAPERLILEIEVTKITKWTSSAVWVPWIAPKIPPIERYAFSASKLCSNFLFNSKKNKKVFLSKILSRFFFIEKVKSFVKIVRKFLVKKSENFSTQKFFTEKKYIFFGVEKCFRIQFRYRKRISFDWWDFRGDSRRPDGARDYLVTKMLRKPRICAWWQRAVLVYTAWTLDANIQSLLCWLRSVSHAQFDFISLLAGCNL